jgi:hypothetical protein
VDILTEAESELSEKEEGLGFDPVDQESNKSSGNNAKAVQIFLHCWPELQLECAGFLKSKPTD